MTTHVSTERTIFLEAIEKPSEAERNAFVEGACLGNPQLKAEVHVLLRAHQESGDLLDAPEAIFVEGGSKWRRGAAEFGGARLLSTPR